MGRKSNDTGLGLLLIVIGIVTITTLGPAGIALLFFLGVITAFILLIKFLVGGGSSGSTNFSYSANTDSSNSVSMSITFDDVLKDQIRLGESSVEYLKKGGIKKITIPVYFSELNLNKDVSAKSVDELKGKIEDLVEKWADKYKAHLDKIEAREKKQALQEFNLNTIKMYGIDVNRTKISNPGSVSFNLKDEVKVVEISNSNFFHTEVKVTNQKITNFILNGKLNSVLGIDGLNNFKSEILSLIESNSRTPLTQSELKEIIFKSGVHYEYEFAPESLRKYDDETKWKAFLRQILVYDDVKILSEIDVSKIKERHYKIFDEFNDGDKENLERVISDSSAYLLNDLTEYLNKLNEKLIA